MIDSRHFEFVYSLEVDVPLWHVAGHGPAESFAEFEVGESVAPECGGAVAEEVGVGAFSDGVFGDASDGEADGVLGHGEELHERGCGVYLAVFLDCRLAGVLFEPAIEACG